MTKLVATDVSTFFRDSKDTVYRLWKYKKIYTPYELDKRFKDESIYEDDTCTFVKIIDIMEIPNDILIKFRVMFDDCLYDDEKNFTDSGCYIFERLSDIKLSEYDYDNKR